MVQKTDKSEPPTEDDFYDDSNNTNADEAKADFDAEETNAKEEK